MKLISLHIEQFGIFSDYDFSFENGLNALQEDNGWGKTTLSTFIRVMFYGFRNEGKRNELDNERKRYLPWGGGVYGGTLTFEVSGKRYRIERTFGEKKDDTFMLYDAVTNLPSDAYTDPVGKALFGIDAESFIKTVWIGQQDCAGGVTDDIHARIGRVSEDVTDIASCDKALETLKNEINRLSDHRKTGLIYKNKEQLAAYETDLLEKEVLLADIEELHRQIEERQDYDQLGRLQEIWENRIREEMNAKTQLHKMQQQFPDGKVLDPGEIEQHVKLLREMSYLDERMQAYRLKEDEEEFLDSKGDFYLSQSASKEIERASEAWNRYKKLSRQLQDKSQENTQGPSPLCLVLGMFLLFAGAAGCALSMTSDLLPIGIGFAGIVMGICLLMAYGLRRSSYRRQIEDVQREDVLRKKKWQYYLLVKTFLEELGYDWQEQEVSGYLVQIQNDRLMANRLDEQREIFRRMVKQKELLEEKRNRFCVDHAVRHEEDTVEHFEFLYTNAFRYKELEMTAAQRTEDREAFERSLGTDQMDAIRRYAKQQRCDESASANSSSLYQQKRKALDEELLQIRQQLAQKKLHLQKLQEIEVRKERLVQEIAEQQDQLEVIKLTKNCLEEAKERYNMQYLQPIGEAFAFYYRKLTGETAELFEWDANLKVAFREYGRLRDTGLMSSGYRDLIGLCYRMAVVSVMYPDERPFLILDDPFVNLDEEKIRYAAAFLRELATEYQVIYFTCHSSRMIEKWENV